jgi:hypothetical protein
VAVAAHTVGDHEELVVTVDLEGVLVVAPDPAGVR